MKQMLLLVLALCFPLVGIAQSPFVADSYTVALWHFDESSGTEFFDASAYANTGSTYGTSIVTGRFGNALYFNGYSSAGWVPASSSLNFSSSQSFTIEAWFRSTSFAEQQILRRGLAPLPGYQLRLRNGFVEAEIGNRHDGTPPDTVLRITSTQAYNDGNWHLATFVRDRASQTMLLYVDATPAASPVNDHFPFDLANELPLDVGQWSSLGGVDHFSGTIDEIRISNIARHPSVMQSDTVALWHFNEESGSNVMDSSPYGNNGTALGTTVIAGRDGNARHFNGQGDYVAVAGNPSFNFGSEQSFTIEAWFRTTATDTGEILRYGLAPAPGYAIRNLDGHVQGIIGSRDDYPPPNKLIRITSSDFYNDGAWHCAQLVRDRQAGTLHLYVDGREAAPPVIDDFTLAIASNHPVLMGRWENSVYPTYFTGDIDEVAIYRGARHPLSFYVPDIQVEPSHIDFGSVMSGASDDQTFIVRNASSHDTLHITEIGSSNPLFAISGSSFSLVPGEARQLTVTYSPITTGQDTGTIGIASNDPDTPLLRIALEGRCIALGADPIIRTIRDIPNDQGRQVRVIWHRSMYDGVNDSLHIVAYSIWRRIDDEASPTSPTGGSQYRDAQDDLWDFVATLPAVGFAQYAMVVPTLYDSTVLNGNHWSTFRVSAHTTNGMVFFSSADSGYSVDNLAPHPPLDFAATHGTEGVDLSWGIPADPDIRHFVIHRSAQQNFIPSNQTLLATTPETHMHDTRITGMTMVYYKVAAVDSSGNIGTFSNEIGLLLTGTTTGKPLPTEFALHQNFPNPFNPETKIQFDIPHTSHVRIAVFDIQGREIAGLVDGWQPAGIFTVRWSPRENATGVYFCRMSAGSFTSVIKLVYIR